MSDLACVVVGGTGTLIAICIRKKVFEVDALTVGHQQRKEALRIIARDPSEALRLGIGQVDVNEYERFPDGGLIDVNNASQSAIHKHLSIGDEAARRLVEIRGVIGGYESLPDLCVLLGFAPQMFDAFGPERLVFLPAKGRTHELLLPSALEHLSSRESLNSNRLSI